MLHRSRMLIAFALVTAFFAAPAVGLAQTTQPAEATRETPATPEVRADDQTKDDKVAAEKATQALAAEKARAEKVASKVKQSDRGTIRFQFDGVDYKDVIRRFAQIAGKPIIGDYNVPGKLTFFDSRKYTFEEAFDTLNVILEMRGFALVEEERWFRLVELTNIGSKSKILKGLDTDDAKKLSPSEIVTVVLPLRFIDAGTASKAVVRWVSSWGSISVLAKGKGIIVTDRLAKIKRIRDLLKMLDTESLVQRQMKTYQLKHASAKAVSEMINKLFGSARQMVYNAQTGRYEPRNTGVSLTAVSDDRTNSILLLGAGDQLALAEQVMEKLDRKEGAVGGDIRIFELKKAQAEDIAKTVNAVVQGTVKKVRGKKAVITKDVKVVADQATNRVVVSAPVDEMSQVAELISRLDEATRISGGAKIFRLKHADAGQLAGVITNAVSKRDSRGRRVSGVTVSVDSRNNAMIIAGAGGDIDTAAQLIEQLDVKPTTEAREVHVVHLKNGDAREIGRALEQTFASETRDARGRVRRQSNIQVSTDRSSNTLIIAAAGGEWPRVQEVLEKLQAQAQDVATPSTRLIALQHAKVDQLVRTLNEIFSPRGRGRRRGSSDAPVTITSSQRSNSLLVSAAEDDQAKIAELVKRLDVPSSEKIEPFLMIRLQSADAEALAAKIMSMLPRPRRGQPQDVFLQPDKLTNSILLRASEEKRQLIEDIIAKLDKATQSEARETRTVQLEHTSADAMAQVLGQMFSGGSSRRRGRWSRSVSADADRVVITPAPGDKTLVIDAPRSKMAEITNLIATLDTDESGGQTEVRTYQLTNSNAQEVSRSLARLFGSSRRGRRGSGSSVQPDPRFEADTGTNQVLISATPGQFEQIEPLIEKLTKSAAVAMKARLFKLKYVKAEDMVPVLETTLAGAPSGRRGRGGSGSVRIATMKLANTIILQAPPAKVALAEELIKSFDTEDSGLQTTIEIVQLVNAQAETLADTMNAVLASQSGGGGRRRRWRAPQDSGQGVAVTAETNSNSIIVRGPAVEVADAVAMVRKIDADAASMTVETKTFKLKHTKAKDLVGVLQEMVTGQQASRSRWGRRGRGSNSPQIAISAVSGANAIVVKAPAAEMELAGKLIAEFDREDSGAAVDVQIVRLVNAEAATLADAVNATIGGEQQSRRRWGRRSTPETGNDRVVVIPESNSNSVLVRGPKAQVPEIVEMVKKIDADSTTLASQTRTFKLKFVKVDDILPVLQQLTTDTSRSRYSRRGSSSSGQVRIASMKAANSLVIQGPPDKLAMAEELIRTFDTEDSGVRTTVQVVQLENAEAASLADSVNASIRKEATSNRRRYGRGGPTPGTDAVLVTPESNSNSLIVRGPALDVADAVAMIRKLDADAGAASGETKTFQLQHAKAGDLVPMLESMIAGSTSSRSRWGRRRSTSSRKEVRISAVSGSNAIVVKAPPAEMALAAKLIDEFDREEADSAVETQIVRLVNAEAASLADAVNATIGGQPQSRRRGRRSTPAANQERVVVIPESNSNSVLVRGPRDDVPAVVEMIQKIDADSTTLASQTRTFKLKFVKVDDILPVLEQLTASTNIRSRYNRRGSTASGQVRIASMKAANTIVVQGPPDKLAMAEELVSTFDTEDSGIQTTIEVVQLENAQADTLADAVNATLQKNSSASGRRRGRSSQPEPDTVLVIPETNSNSVIVRGPALGVTETVAMIRKLDADAGSVAGETKTFKLQHAKANDLVEMLESMLTGTSSGRSRWGRRRSSGDSKVRISAVSGANAIVVKAPPAELSLAEALIKEFDTDESGTKPKVQLIRLENADAESLADTVNATLSGQSGKRRRNRRNTGDEDKVVVIAETNSNSVIVRGPASQVPEVVAMVEKIDAESGGQAVVTRTFRLEHAKAADLVGVLQEIVTGAQQRRSRWGRRSSQGGQIRISAVVSANAIVVKAPQKDMALAEQLIKQFDAADSGAAPAVEIVRLQNAEASSLADAVNATLSGGSSGRRGRGRSSSDSDDKVVVIPESNSNSVIVRGPRSEVPGAVEMVRSLDDDSTTLAIRTRTFQLKHAKADDIVTVLEPMLTGTSGGRSRYRRAPMTRGVARVVAMSSTNSVVVQGTPEKIALAEELIKQFDSKDQAQSAIRIVRLQKATAESLARSVNESLSEKGGRYRRSSGGATVSVTAESNSNSVLVRGPSSLVDETVAMIKELDEGSQGGDVQIRVYPLKNSEAEELARSVGKLFQDIIRQQQRGRRGTPTVPFSVTADTRTNSLVVSTTPAHFALVDDMLAKLDKEEERSERDVEYVWLQNADAATVASQLESMFRDRRTQDRPVIEADYFTNALTLIGKDADLKAMRQIIEKLDDAAKDNNIRVRVVTLKDARAEKMAELIREMYGQMTESEIVVTDKLPETGTTNGKKEANDSPIQLPNFAPDFEAEEADANEPEPKVSNAGKEKILDVSRPKVTIAVDKRTNALIISGTRRELDNIESLINQLAASEGALEAELKVFKVVQADPVTVASTLDALFNPVKPRQQQRRKKGEPAPAPVKPDVTVVPDVRTKSVIVRAKPDDMELIEPLIAKLDEVSTIVSEVRIFKVQNTDAEDVAANLRELFRLSAGPSGQARSKPPKGKKTPNQTRADAIRQVIELKREEGVARVDASTQVSITANNKTNSVIVAAPAEAMGLIGGMIQELDQSAATTQAAVRMYPLQHAEVKATVATLQEIFRARQDTRRARRGASTGQDEPIVITGDTRGGQVVVSAPVDKHELIAKVVADLDNAKSDEKLLVKVYKIVNADAQGIVSAIGSALEVSADTGRRRRGSQDDDGGIRLSADRSSNAIVARASTTDHERIASLIEQMDITPGAEAAVQVIQLTKGDPEVIAETLTRLFGSASSRGRRGGGTTTKGVAIEADKSSRTLMVRADEATFARIRTLAVKLDTGAVGDVKRTILAVENGSAVTIASALQQAFVPQGRSRYNRRRSGGDEQIAIVPEPASNSLIVTANDEDLGKVKALLAKLDSESAEGTRTEFIVLKYAKAEDLAGVLSAVSGGGGSRRGRRGGTQTSATGVTISADTSANALVMNGPSKELDRLMAMAMKLDSAAEGKTQPVFKTYAVKKADVSSMVTALQEVFGSDSRRRRRGETAEVPVVIVADDAGSRVVVSASSEKHKLISGIISDLDSEETGSQVVVRVYKLKHGEARSLGWTLQNAWQKQQRGRGASTDQTRIAGDSSSNSIVVRAAERDQAEIARLIKEMDAPAEVTFPVQAIPLNNAEPTEVARVLQSVFDAGGGRRRGGWGVKKQTVVIEASDDSRLIMVRADEKTFAKVRELAAQLDQETSGKATRTILPLEWARADSVATALTRAFQPPRGQKVGPDEQVGVVAESGSNSIIVTANEKNLARVKTLLGDLDKEGSRRSELLLLQHARATELADVLAKAAGASSGGGRRGRGGTTPQGVVVTADAGSNALVMTGPTGEIDKLMKMALQLDQATQGAQPGVFIIGLENSYASDIARMIENLYRTQAEAARKEKKNIDPLGVSADERANAVVLATTKEMYQTVSKWVEEVEALKPARGATRIISLENADPAEVEKVIQQMLEKGGAMQVRRGRNNRRRNESSGSERVKTTVLENQRSIMVEASDEDFQAIMKVVAALDKAAADAKKLVKIYNLENATNTQVAAALGQVYRATRETPAKDVVTVTALRETNAVVVSAAKEKMEEVGHLIEQLDKKEVAPQVEIRIYPLTNAQPEKIVDPLRKMLQQIVRTRQGESIDVQADQRTRAIIVTAKADFFDQVGKVIELLDKQPAYAKAQVLILPLKRADATQLAVVLNEMLRPGSGNQVTPEARALQEQVRLLRVRSAIKDQIPELDLTKPIKISADPARPQGSNSLIISSTEDNLTALREIVSILDAVPVTEGTKVRLLHLKNADAQVVQAILQDIFVKGRQLAGKQGSTVQGKAEPKSTSGRALVNVLNISADPRTNTLVLSGLEESLALAEAVVADLDKYEGRIITDVKAFQLKHADAGRIAGMLMNVFRENPDTWLAGARTYVSRLRIAMNDDKSITTKIPKNRTPLSIQADPETNILLVAARADLMPLVSEAVETLDIPSPASDAGVRVVPLENADASRVQQVVQQLFQSRTAGMRRPWDIPTVTVDTRTNSLVISASERTHAMLDGLLRKLDSKQEIDVRDINIIPLENAEATQMADTLQKMMDARVQRQAALGMKDAESLRVVILADPRSNSLVIGGSKESYAMVAELARQMDGASSAIGGQIQTIDLKEANAGTLATTLMNLFNQRYAAARTADVARQKPIILPDLRTNSLLVSANKDDSKVLQGLLKKLDVKLTDPAVQLTVIPMEHNDAGAIGPMIQQIFQARLASMTAQGQTPSPQDKVDVATDVLSNSLIVSASKENLSLIRGLLEKIDVEPPSKTGVVRIYALQNASAARVSGMLKSLLSQGLYKPGLVAAGNNQARAAMEQVAIEIDTRTNVLIVSASKENFAVIEEIIKKVDSTNDYAEGGDIRTYPLTSADATKLAPMLQQFLNQKRQAEITAGGSDLSLPTTIIADGRTNTLLVAGSRENFQAVEAMVKRLDGTEVAMATGFEVFELEHATATALQGTLQKLFEGRIERGNTKNPVTVLADTKTNSVIIGAAPDEMKIARVLVKKLDVEEKTTESGETMRIFPLAKADASQVAETLKELYPPQDGKDQITVSVDERINAVIVTAGGNDLKRINELVEKLDRPKVTRVTEIRVFTLTNAEAEELATILTATLTNKPKAMTNRSPNLQNLLQFVSKTKEGKELITSALQEGVLITPDPRTNSLIVTAPSDNMPLLNTLISSLDSTSPRTAEIKVFKLDNADCRSMAEVLVQLFKLQTGGQTDAKSVKYTLVSEEKAPSVSATLGTAEQHALSVTVDVRTNSLLVGGTKQYVQLAEEVIRELDASPGQERQTKIYRLRNAQADEIETTLQNFLDSERQRLQATLGTERMVAAQRLIEREVTVVAEKTTNTLLLSASPRYFKTIADLIAELDQPPPQVLIQVLLAEITLDDETDVGFDWNYANEKDGRTYAASTNFGVEAGINTAGGFNLSVTGSDLSFFFRALKSQGRLNVLQRPQIVAADNQAAEINVGQRVPFITNSRITDNGDVINTVQYEDVAIALSVTPRINPDGFVKLDVDQKIESLSTSTIQITDGVNAVIVNSRQATTTVTVQDGHTILIGGLITSEAEDIVSKVPVLGDVPLVGNLFKSTQQRKKRTELLIVLTPKVLRTTEDTDEITDPQIKRMNYLRKLNSGDLKDAAFELLGDEKHKVEPILDANPDDPQETTRPSEVKVPVEMLPELYRLHRELQEKKRKGQLKKDLAEEMNSKEADAEALAK